MLKGQHFSKLGHSAASTQMKTVYGKPNKCDMPPFRTHFAQSKATRPVQCNGTNKDTAPPSKLVAKASKTVDGWLAEDTDFSDFYYDVEGNTDRSVS